MKATDTLKAVEDKMNNALLTYSQRSWSDTELEKCLIDELRNATIDFLELRGQVSHGCGPALLASDLRL
jgi:tryptophan synthase alpha subunit